MGGALTARDDIHMCLHVYMYVCTLVCPHEAFTKVRVAAVCVCVVGGECPWFKTLRQNESFLLFGFHSMNVF